MRAINFITLIVAIISFQQRIFSQQLKLGDFPYKHEKAAILEMESANQGLLFPRLSDTTQINNLNPLDGTVIYFTQQKKLLLRSNGSWQPVTLPNDIAGFWSTAGNITGAMKSIGSSDNFALQLITNNLERMRILANGNVGIGSTAPSQKLEVTGNFRLTGAFMPGNSAGTTGSLLMSAGANTSPYWIDPNTYLNGLAWQLTGNNTTSNRKLGTTTAYAIEFITGNLERMRLTQGGFFGIGTTAPGNYLEVAGTNSFTSGLRLTTLSAAVPTANNGKALSIDANGDVIVTSIASPAWSMTGNTAINAATDFLGTTDDKQLILKSFNSRLIEFGRRETLGLTQAFPDYNDNNEMVTHLFAPLQFNAPAAEFYKPKIYTDVNGNFRIKGSSAGTDYFEMGSTGSGNNGGFEFIIGDDGDEPIVFKSYNYLQGMSEIMRLQSGRMAVGSNAFNATNPEKLLIDAGVTNSYNLMTGKGNINNYLQINVQNQSGGNTASSDLVATANNGNESINFVDLGINSGGFTNTAYPIIGGVNNAYLYSTGNDFVIGNGTAGRALRFFTGGFANANERLRIDANGNVGIGNTDPLFKLHVTGNFASTNDVVVDHTNTNNGDMNTGALRFGSTSGEGIASKRTGGGNQNGLDIYTSFARRMSIANGGLITFYSNIVPSGDNSISLGALGARWTAVYAANGTIQTSDRRQKTNIVNLDRGLAEVLQMQPVRYTWKGDSSTTQKLGLIAQDVRKLVPEVVVGDELKESLGMNYAELVPVLINAIKEEQQQIIELRKQLQELQKQVLQLQKRLP